MRVLIISPGKKHEQAIGEAIAEYEKRLTRRLSIEWAFPEPGTKEEEGAAILRKLKQEDTVLLLDERGKQLSSEAFADFVRKQEGEGTKRLVIIIGGAFGVGVEVAKRANSTLSLSPLVFPHQLVRLIITEQLYRATTIIDGGKYHHA